MSAGDVPSGSLDRVFHALADETRRDILRRCNREQISVSKLAAAYAMSFAAVQKHVAVLEQAGLVQKQQRGRERLVTTTAGQLREAQLLLDALELAWRNRVDQMASLLAAGDESTDSKSDGPTPGIAKFREQEPTKYRPEEGTK